MRACEEYEFMYEAKHDADIGRRIVVVLSIILLAVITASPMARSKTIFSNGFESDGGELPVDYCVDPLVFPPGWTIQPKSWTIAFSGYNNNSPKVQYPRGPSWPVDEGAQKSSITIIPFTPNPSQSVLAYWDQVQSRAQDGYLHARPARSMLVAITPCGADVRAPNYLSLDPFEKPECRKIENSAAIAWTTAVVVGACKVEAGKNYWMVFAAVNTNDGLQYAEDTCEDVPNSALGCDVGVVFSTGPASKVREWLSRSSFKLYPFEN